MLLQSGFTYSPNCDGFLGTRNFEYIDRNAVKINRAHKCTTLDMKIISSIAILKLSGASCFPHEINNFQSNYCESYNYVVFILQATIS